MSVVTKSRPLTGHRIIRIPMKRLTVALGQDHVEGLAKGNPLSAVEELIWNSLDADAKAIEVTLSFSALGALSELRVTDNGLGIRYTDCDLAFGKIGESLKLNKKLTPNGRLLHGKFGKGRFRAFGIGHTVTWNSRYKHEESVNQFTITGHCATIREFVVSDEQTAYSSETGVTVSVTDIDQSLPGLQNTDKVVLELSKRLALYLRQYPGITITYDGTYINSDTHVSDSTKYPLTLKGLDGNEAPATLVILEWNVPIDRALYLCDAQGFTVDEKPAGIQAPGFRFTAYLSSPLIETLAESGALAADALHEVVAGVLDKAREQLKTHFREKEAAAAKDLVRQWKDEKVYPFEVPPSDAVEEAERQVFDVCAMKVQEFLPDFQKTEQKNKRLTFRLIREALERNPHNLQAILRQVLDLPTEQQTELAALLERTKLSAIINVSKMVMDRLDFLNGLDCILFGDLKKSVLERTQLHRILSEELWVFGDNYARGVDDESLKELLKKHIKILGRTDVVQKQEKVRDLDGKTRIVDLMLYRQYPTITPGTYEHLVLEFKKPDCKIGEKEIGQIEKYGITVAADERFDKAKTKWTFMLIGNELTTYAEHRCAVRDYGHIYESSDRQLNIFVHKWSTVMAAAKWRHEFLRDKLNAQVTKDDGLAFLRAKYAHYLPASATKDAVNGSATSPPSSAPTSSADPNSGSCTSGTPGGAPAPAKSTRARSGSGKRAP